MFGGFSPRTTAASCGVTVMMVFNKGVSHKISLKLYKRIYILREGGEGPLMQFFFQFRLNIQQSFI